MSFDSSAADRRQVHGGIPRAVEATLAAIGLVACSPLLALVALGVFAASPSEPVLFRQRRVGRGGVQFTLLKFRTMHVNANALGVTARGDPRISRLGRWLRLLKLDELPELWNVLRGDMSLVGPRPEVPHYVDLGNPAWHVVLRARPGLTDPVTLRLRNEEELLARAPGSVEKFYLEALQPYKLHGYAEYLRQRSLASDVAVIVRTLVAVVAPSTVTHPSFEEIAAASRHGKQQQPQE